MQLSRLTNCSMWIACRLFCLFIPLISGEIATASIAPSIQSPWSNQPIAGTDVPYACPAILHIPSDLVTDSFYRLDDPTHSIIDPVRMEAYSRSSGVVKQAGLNIVHAADAYRQTGSHQAALCAIQQIALLAQENSLNGKMSSNQAYYVQGWVVGAIAVAYLKVESANLVQPAQRESIVKWLHGVGEQTRAYYELHKKTGSGDAQNNHLYWAAVELAAISSVTQDQSDFEWAMRAYDIGVNQILPNGELPQEMARGQRALHYHLYALAPLVLVAEFGEANHRDLYAHANGAIHRLVNFAAQGLVDPTPFTKATGIRQEVPKAVSGDQIGWAPPYLKRFPNSLLQEFVNHAPDMSVYYLGGLPPGK